MVTVEAPVTATDGPEVDQAEDAEYGECPTCGPDQEADADAHCTWCGRALILGADLRSDPNWWAE